MDEEMYLPPCISVISNSSQLFNNWMYGDYGEINFLKTQSSKSNSFPTDMMEHLAGLMLSKMRRCPVTWKQTCRASNTSSEWSVMLALALLWVYHPQKPGLRKVVYSFYKHKSVSLYDVRLNRPLQHTGGITVALLKKSKSINHSRCTANVLLLQRRSQRFFWFQVNSLQKDIMEYRGAKEFVDRNFYVEGGLTSIFTEETADLLKRT